MIFCYWFGVIHIILENKACIESVSVEGTVITSFVIRLSYLNEFMYASLCLIYFKYYLRDLRFFTVVPPSSELALCVLVVGCHMESVSTCSRFFL